MAWVSGACNAVQGRLLCSPGWKPLGQIIWLPQWTTPFTEGSLALLNSFPAFHSSFPALLRCSSADAVLSSFKYTISLSLYYWEYLPWLLEQQLNVSACHFVFVIHDTNLSQSLWEHTKWLVLNKQTKILPVKHRSPGVCIGRLWLRWLANDSDVHSNPQRLFSWVYICSLLSTLPSLSQITGSLFWSVMLWPKFCSIKRAIILQTCPRNKDTW